MPEVTNYFSCFSQKVEEGPDLSYSLKTKGFMAGTVVALIAGIAGAVLLSTATGGLAAVLGAAVIMGIGFTCAIVFPVLGISDRTKDVGDRIFKYANSLRDEDAKILWMGKAADKWHVDAIVQEFELGKDLIIRSKEIEDEEAKQAALEKGLQVLNSALNHCYANDDLVRTYLNRHPELKTRLIERYKSQEAEDLETTLLRYGTEVIEGAGNGRNFQPFWKPVLPSF